MDFQNIQLDKLAGIIHFESILSGNNCDLFYYILTNRFVHGEADSDVLINNILAVTEKIQCIIRKFKNSKLHTE